MPAIRIVLIIPPFVSPDPATVPLVESPLVTEPLGMESIAATLQTEGHEVNQIHCQMEDYSPDQAVEMILACRPDMVGISLNFLLSEFLGAKALAETLRFKGFSGPIFTGGYAASFLYRQILKLIPDIDLVCLGEAEDTCRDLAENFISGKMETTGGIAFRRSDRIVSAPRACVTDLDRLPFSQRHFLKKYRERFVEAQVETSRGCSWGGCTFCSVKKFHDIHNDGIWKPRSVPRVVDEVSMLVDNFDIKRFEFIDDNFVGPKQTGRQRALAFASELARRRLDIEFTISCRVEATHDLEVLQALRQVGLIKCNIGIESNVDTTLEFFQKGTRTSDFPKALRNLIDTGIVANLQFIMFDRETTLEHLRRNIDFLKYWIGRYYPQVTIRPANLINRLVYYPGSPLYDREIDLRDFDAATDLQNLVGQFYIVAPFRHREAQIAYDACKMLFYYLLRDISRFKALKMTGFNRFARKPFQCNDGGLTETQVRCAEDWNDGLPPLMVNLFGEVVSMVEEEAGNSDNAAQNISNYLLAKYAAFNLEQLGTSAHLFFTRLMESRK